MVAGWWTSRSATMHEGIQRLEVFPQRVRQRMLPGMKLAKAVKIPANLLAQLGGRRRRSDIAGTTLHNAQAPRVTKSDLYFPRRIIGN